jgi:hypothetical protein
MTDSYFEEETYFPPRDRYPATPVICREEFLEEFGDDYHEGQHVTLIGPTQRGKSRMSKEMAKRVISDKLRLIVLLGKPPQRERTWTDEAADELNLQVIESWPETFIDQLRNLKAGRGWKKNASGYLLRPHHTMTDLQRDKETLTAEFRKAMIAAYASTKQKYIILVDEGHHVEVDLRLKEESEAPLMRGAPDAAKWTNLQRGFWVSKLNYNMPEHILLFKDKSTAEQQRYAEIGGVDPRYLIHVIKNLKTKRAANGGTYSQCVYFRRVDDDVRIIDTE